MRVLARRNPPFFLSSIFALFFAKRMGFYGTWTHIGPCKSNINKIMCKREFVRPEETTVL